MAVLPENFPNKYVDEDGVKWTYSRCFFCHMNCPLLVGTVNDEIVEIRPNGDTVLCDRMGKKGERAIKFHYHPKRINYALKRVGPKGKNQFEQIPYEQAMDEIAEKLQALKEQYGAETLVASEGTYRSDHLWARTRFFNLFGNPGNIVDPGTICWCFTYTLNMSMVGWPVELSLPPTAPEAKCMVFWGARSDEKYGHQSPLWRTIKMSITREGEQPHVIVVDPVCIESVKYADVWLPIRPGTDLYMQMTWVNYIIQNKLYDEEFVKEWSNGPFLVRKDNNLLIRGSDIDKNGKFEDFVVWDDKTQKTAIWCSNESRYYDGLVNAPISGEHEITLADGSKIQVWTAFDAIAANFAEYTPEKASEICGVQAYAIINAIEIYAKNTPGFICWGVGGADMHGINASGSTITKTILRCLTGSIDKLGGEYIGSPGTVGPNGEKDFAVRDAELELSERVTPETRKKFLGNDQFRVMSWHGFEKIDKCYRKMWNMPRPMLHQLLVSPTLCWDAILKEEPYPVKAMICWSSNPLAWAPNTRHVYEALKALELLVVVDYWKTPTAAIADYIIPAADSLERPMGTTGEDALDFLDGGDRGAPPVGDRRTDYDFFRALGVRLGQEADWPWETYEDVVAYRAERAGYSYDDFVTLGTIPSSDGFQFEKHKQILPNGQTRGFATPSRKAEIFPSVVQEIGYDPLPHYRDLPESRRGNPELAKEYPLNLTVGGRFTPMYHSEFRVPGAGTRSQFPWPVVKIHMYDAKRLGIREGDWVWIETKRGRIRQKASLGWDIVEGSVQAQPSWWFPEMPAEEPWSQGIFESGGNVLTDDSIESLDEMTATWITRGLLCKIYPCVDPYDRADEEIPVETFKAGDTFWHKFYQNLDKDNKGNFF